MAKLSDLYKTDIAYDSAVAGDFVESIEVTSDDHLAFISEMPASFYIFKTETTIDCNLRIYHDDSFRTSDLPRPRGFPNNTPWQPLLEQELVAGSPQLFIPPTPGFYNNTEARKIFIRVLTDAGASFPFTIMVYFLATGIRFDAWNNFLAILPYLGGQLK